MTRKWGLLTGLLLVGVAAVFVQAQRTRSSQISPSATSLTVEEYSPRSTLRVETNPVPRAKFPVIDVHSHHRPGFSLAQWSDIVESMDELNLQVLVNLSGGSGSSIVSGIETVQASNSQDRMVFFANLDFRGRIGPRFGERAAAQLERDVEAGAVGLKFFKNFGIDVRDESGVRVGVDDPELDPVFETAGRLNIPVLTYGLRTDFRGELFEGSQQLLALADELREIKTVCHCGRKAIMTVRLDNDGKPIHAGEQIQIGGNEHYVSMCRIHFKDAHDNTDR